MSAQPDFNTTSFSVGSRKNLNSLLNSSNALPTRASGLHGLLSLRLSPSSERTISSTTGQNALSRARNSRPSTILLLDLFKTYSDVLSHQYSLNDSGTGYSIHVCCFNGLIKSFSSDL